MDASELYAELFRFVILSLYESFPELSVEPFHERLTVVEVIAVTVRLVGVVGADRSPLPADRTDPSTRKTVVKASAAIVMIRREELSVVMIDPPLDERPHNTT